MVTCFVYKLLRFDIKAHDKHVKFSFRGFFFSPFLYSILIFLFVLRPFFSWIDLSWEIYSLLITWKGTYEGKPFSMRDYGSGRAPGCVRRDEVQQIVG